MQFCIHFFTKGTSMVMLTVPQGVQALERARSFQGFDKVAAENILPGVCPAPWAQEPQLTSDIYCTRAVNLALSEDEARRTGLFLKTYMISVEVYGYLNDFVEFVPKLQGVEEMLWCPDLRGKELLEAWKSAGMPQKWDARG